MKFVNSEVGKQLCLRGINAKGEIAGWFSNSSNEVEGFIVNAGGTYTTFGVSGSNQTEGQSLDSEDVIAGDHIGNRASCAADKINLPAKDF